MRFVPVNLLTVIILPVLIFSRGCTDRTPDNEKITAGRIISLSPSVTGQIIDLGAEESLVGVTPYHPPLKKDVPVVGTYINPSIEKIVALKPDIILMSEDDADIQQNSFFKKFGLRYFMFGRNSGFDDICSNYIRLAEITGKKRYGEEKIAYYRKRLNSVRAKSLNTRVVFLVSVRPLITVSGSSHISNIIGDAGGTNVFKNLKNPYPILTLESLITADPDVVIIMNPGEDVYLYDRLRNFTGIGFIKRKNIFVAGDSTIPYYSPKEYVLSVEKISEILNHVNK